LSSFWVRDRFDKRTAVAIRPTVKTKFDRLVVLLENVDREDAGALLGAERRRRRARDVTGNDFRQDPDRGGCDLAPLDGSDGGRFSPCGTDVRQGSRSQRLGEHRARRERLEVRCSRSRGSAIGWHLRSSGRRLQRKGDAPASRGLISFDGVATATVAIVCVGRVGREAEGGGEASREAAKGQASSGRRYS
jgi:hypothetical protein